ncbi:uncharacterized protein VP01_3493g1 [Puccinia sorghi]|uniref:Uncharacterized protein n=1 Tax=Puccinia sorghi TaxID=27349 RepID=A0A0L6UVW4_9BASI|nr:uncharacterized protein VP01_3493g1 [Puccinia sorghi]
MVNTSCNVPTVWHLTPSARNLLVGAVAAKITTPGTAPPKTNKTNNKPLAPCLAQYMAIYQADLLSIPPVFQIYPNKILHLSQPLVRKMAGFWQTTIFPNIILTRISRSHHPPLFFQTKTLNHPIFDTGASHGFTGTKSFLNDFCSLLSPISLSVATTNGDSFITG